MTLWGSQLLSRATGSDYGNNQT